MSYWVPNTAGVLPDSGGGGGGGGSGPSGLSPGSFVDRLGNPLLAWVTDPFMANKTFVSSAYWVYLGLVPLAGPATFNRVSSTASAGATPNANQNFIGLYKGTLLAGYLSTLTLAAHTAAGAIDAWLALSYPSFATFALNTPVSVLATDVLYVAVLAGGNPVTWTAAQSVLGVYGGPIGAGNTLAPAPICLLNGSSSFTSLPPTMAAASLVGNLSAPWVALS